MPYLKFDTNEHKIDVDEYRIILPENTRNCVRIIGDTSEGKSILTVKFEKYSANVKVYYSTEISHLTIQAYNKNDSLNLLVLDECYFLEDTEDFAREEIIKSNKFIIIISRSFKIPNTPILEIKDGRNSYKTNQNLRGETKEDLVQLTKIKRDKSTPIIISEVLTLNEFENKFKNYRNDLNKFLVVGNN
jgi:hypothetical protein